MKSKYLGAFRLSARDPDRRLPSLRRITETLRAEDTTFPDELVAAGCEAAHNHGMRICSHARSDESIIQCLQYGVDVIYHASFISDGTMKLLENQKDRVYVVPAINWLVGTLYDAEAFGCESRW